MRSAKTRDKARKTVTQIRADREPLHSWAAGRVSDVSYNAEGQIDKATITLPNGTQIQNLDAGAFFGLDAGAEVLLEGVGSKASPIWSINRVTRHAPGTAGSGTTQIVSTPVHAFINTTSTPFFDGAIQTTAEFGFYLIAEQWRYNQAIAYEYEIRNGTTLERVVLATTNSYRRVAGTLKTTLAAAEDSTFQIESNGVNPYTEFDSTNGITLIEDELIVYATNATGGGVADFYTLQRGFASTSDVEHVAGVGVTWRGMSVTTPLLDQDTDYEARVRAINANGNPSNWSVWEPFTTGLDTTAPSWSGATGLTATNVIGGVRLTWSSVNVNAHVLGYYEIQDSTDGSTGATVHNVGNGNAWVFNARYGALRWFRIRAVSRNEVRSSWSSFVRAGIDRGVEYGDFTNLLTNGAFPSAVTSWTTTGIGTLNHDNTRGFKAVGCAQLEINRTGSGGDYGIYQTVSSFVAGDVLRAIAYVVRFGTYDETFDEMRLEIRSGSLISSSVVVELASLKVVDTGEWTILETDIVVPSGSTSASVYIWAEYSGTPSEVTFVWVDDIQLYKIGNKS